MGTREEEKKARERWLLEGYLAFRRITPRTVTSGERPDFVIAADVDGEIIDAAVELCEYQGDASSVGGAGSRSLRRFHDRLMEAVQGEGFELTSLNFWLSFDERNPPSPCAVQQFATQLVGFLRQRESQIPPFRQNHLGCTYERWKGHFDDYQLIRNHVVSIRLARPACPGLVASGYNDAACHRLEVRASVIRNLLRKHRVAKWPAPLRNLPLKWLVICAGVETAHDIIGPKLGIVKRSLDALAPEAAACGFDLVTFWECRADWEHHIWQAGSS